MTGNSFLGVYVDPVHVPTEGIAQIFDNLESVRARAISLPLRVGRPATGAEGVRFPPLHIDGHERVIARPIWGQRELQLETFSCFAPNLDLYQETPYKPRSTPLPSDVDGEAPSAMMAEARNRGMEVHVTLQPFLPPDLRDEDRPVLVDGSQPQPPFVARNACLNAPAARRFALARIQDTVEHAPRIDGLFLDWAEYGAYLLPDHFTCFCRHCERQARRDGYDWDAMRRDVRALWDWLHALEATDLERASRALRSPSALVELLAHHPGCLQLLRFKGATVAGFYRQVRDLLDHLGLKHVVISARGWPPPWNRSSGMDYRALAEVCAAVTPKLFTFDYSALPRWYGMSLMRWNPGLPESAVLDALVAWMNLGDDIERRTFDHYHVPAPDESHPARVEVYQSRLDDVVDQVAGRARCYPFAHAYLPEPQWAQMVSLLRNSRVDGMWVHMYAYLSERKLAILREAWR